MVPACFMVLLCLGKCVKFLVSLPVPVLLLLHTHTHTA